MVSSMYIPILTIYNSCYAITLITTKGNFCQNRICRIIFSCSHISTRIVSSTSIGTNHIDAIGYQTSGSNSYRQIGLRSRLHGVVGTNSRNNRSFPNILFCTCDSCIQRIGSSQHCIPILAVGQTVGSGQCCS